MEPPAHRPGQADLPGASLCATTPYELGTLGMLLHDAPVKLSAIRREHEALVVPTVVEDWHRATVHRGRLSYRFEVATVAAELRVRGVTEAWVEDTAGVDGNWIEGLIWDPAVGHVRVMTTIPARVECAVTGVDVRVELGQALRRERGRTLGRRMRPGWPASVEALVRDRPCS